MHSHSRRGFLARMLGGAWAAASLLERAALVAARARAQSKETLPVLFDIETVAEGIYAAVARGRALINSNAAIFESPLSVNVRHSSFAANVSGLDIVRL